MKEITTPRLHAAELSPDQVEKQKVFVLSGPLSFFSYLDKAPAVKRTWSSLQKWLFAYHHDIFYVTKPDEMWKHIKNQEERIPYVLADFPLDTEDLLDTIQKWWGEDELPLHTSEWTWEEKEMGSVMKEQNPFSVLPAYLHHQLSKESWSVPGFNQGKPMRFQVHIKDDNKTITTSLVSESIPIQQGKPSPVTVGHMKYELKLEKITLPGPEEENGPWHFVLKTNLKRLVHAPVGKALQYGQNVRVICEAPQVYAHTDKQISVETVLRSNNGKLIAKDERDARLLAELPGMNVEAFLEDPVGNQVQEGTRYHAIYNNRHFLPYHTAAGEGLGLKQRWSLVEAAANKLGMKLAEPLGDNEAPSQGRSMFPFSFHGESNIWDIAVWDDEEQTLFRRLPHDLFTWFGNYTEVMPENVSTAMEKIHWLNGPLRPKEGSSSQLLKHRAILASDPEEWDLLKEAASDYLSSHPSHPKAKYVYVAYSERTDEGKESVHHVSLYQKGRSFHMRFWYRPFGEHARLLVVEKTERTGAWKRLSIEEKIREKQLKSHIQCFPMVRLNLVNLPAYHETKGEGAKAARIGDPKRMIRRVFASLGLTTQFINGDKELDFKWTAAVKDLLQHAEVYPEKIIQSWKESDVWMGCVSLPRAYQHLTLVTRMKKGEALQCRLLTDEQWYTFSEMQTRLLSEKWRQQAKDTKGRKEKDRTAIARFHQLRLEELIEKETLGEDGRLYLVLDAALRSKSFSFLINPRMHEESEWPAHVTLVRTNQEKEVPEVSLIQRKPSSTEDDWTVSLGSGLYTDEKRRVAYSIPIKPDSAEKINHRLFDKEAAPHKRIIKQRACELAVCGAPDWPFQRRVFQEVHKMRNATITHKPEVSECLPIWYGRLLLNLLKKDMD